MTVYTRPNARRELIAKLSTKEGISTFVKSVIFGWGKKDEQAQQRNPLRTRSPEATGSTGILSVKEKL